VIKHSITLVGNKTSISLEDQFWDGLREIARREKRAVCALIEQIDTDRTRHNSSSAVRLYVLNYFKTRTSHQTFPNAPPERQQTGQSRHPKPGRIVLRNVRFLG